MLRIHKDKLFLDEEETLLISGAMHYFRTLPEQWKDRLEKIAAAGFNCVETYAPWNLHEPIENTFDFSGMLDVEKFIKTAEEVGLYVIFRPSPYICAEWEFGGLPSWLLKYNDIAFRTMDKIYIEKIDRYYDMLIPKIKPLLASNGGPIIAVQIENEYGSYGNDSNYLKYLENALTQRGIDVPLFTSDGPTHYMLGGGTLPHIWKTINYGSKTEEAFKMLNNYQTNMPKMVMEFWIGWFDHWGHGHITREPKNMIDEFKKILDNNISVNFYMFHGGTNFGFMSGANFDIDYRPTVTSYDYDSLLTEAGDLTEKYNLTKSVLESFNGKISVKKHKNHKFYSVQNSKKKNYGKVKFTKQANLFRNLESISEKYSSPTIKPMEYFNQSYGYIVYETEIPYIIKNMRLTLQNVRDRALVFFNDEFKGVIDRNSNQEIILNSESTNNNLKILVENMGRINYGAQLKDFKGITEGVRLERQFLFNWNIYTLPMNDISNLNFQPLDCEIDDNNPSFYLGTFEVDEPCDTFITFENWSKGHIYVNGFNLGRYWEIGPQKTLYLPKDLLKSGTNEIVIFELHKFGEYLNLIENPILE